MRQIGCRFGRGDSGKRTGRRRPVRERVPALPNLAGFHGARGGPGEHLRAGDPDRFLILIRSPVVIPRDHAHGSSRQAYPGKLAGEWRS